MMNLRACRLAWTSMRRAGGTWRQLQQSWEKANLHHHHHHHHHHQQAGSRTFHCTSRTTSDWGDREGRGRSGGSGGREPPVRNALKWGAPTLAVAGTIGVTYYSAVKEDEEKEQEENEQKPTSPDQNDASSGLPTYTLEEIATHNSIEKGVWVTHGHKVYDITHFVENHPGGSKILLAAGRSLEPFWNIYTIHATTEVRQILDEMVIGTVDRKSLEAHQGREDTSGAESKDPYVREPKRHPALVLNSQRPFDAETPPQILTDHFYTPNELFMVRNHLPVPKLDQEEYHLEVRVPGRKEPATFSLHDLRTKFNEHTISAAIQCAGNRRDGMHQHRKIYGASSGFTAISNARWTGVLLSDVLRHLGVSDADPRARFVELLGWDTDVSGEPYGAAIPAAKALDPRGDVLLAYEMNGEPLPPDHGYPLRVVAAGFVGARNVKWLRHVNVLDKESDIFWHQKDYKSSPPSVEWGKFRFEEAPPIFEAPVQSAICYPEADARVPTDAGTLTVKGYAYSGGGKGILRVDVSADGGRTWQTAHLTQEPQDYGRAWGWTLWEAEVDVPDNGHPGSLQLVCKAVDTAHNVQPETVSGIWNLRGFLNNSWHRVQVQLTPPDDTDETDEQNKAADK